MFYYTDNSLFFLLLPLRKYSFHTIISMRKKFITLRLYLLYIINDLRRNNIIFILPVYNPTIA